QLQLLAAAMRTALARKIHVAAAVAAMLYQETALVQLRLVVRLYATWRRNFIARQHSTPVVHVSGCRCAAGIRPDPSRTRRLTARGDGTSLSMRAAHGWQPFPDAILRRDARNAPVAAG